MPTPYLVYDVFTERRFGGNQLAIIPDASGLAEADLGAIAREFNFSETVFLGPPDDPAHSAKLRIFTPGGEIPFAGHPTVGTAVMLAEAGLGPELVLELGVGPIAARAEPGRAWFETRVPLKHLGTAEPGLIARCLGLPESALADRPVLATLGLPFCVVRLTDRDALAACTPDLAAFRAAEAAHPEAPGFHIHAWVDAGDVLHARMLAPLAGVVEDPATGSAAATLAALLAEARGGFAGVIQQGDDMGRPSQIEVEAAPGRVRVGGRAVRVMEGSLT